MPSRVGDIYSVYSNQLRQYVACQVTAPREDRGRSYGDVWVTGSSPYLQWRWNTIDAHQRRVFKKMG